MSMAKLTVKRALWKKLMRELRFRGEGRRETGAFLLGRRANRKVTHFLRYDQLDPGAYDTGIIIFNGDGYIPLWNFCAEKKLQVLADVHTHPGEWTGQSPSDRQHPMIAQEGHLALIIPFYAMNEDQLLEGVGIHEFLGDQNWRSWETTDKKIQLLK